MNVDPGPIELPLANTPGSPSFRPAAPDCTELVLEPSDHPAVVPFKQALVEDGIPYTSFTVDDVRAEHDRLVTAGVRITQPPTSMGPITTAVFDDTCGNLVQLASQP